MEASGGRGDGRGTHCHDRMMRIDAAKAKHSRPSGPIVTGISSWPSPDISHPGRGATV